MRQHINKTLMLILVMTIIMVAPVLAQDAIATAAIGGTWTPPPISEWFGSLDQVYSVVVVIGGYLSSKIPGLNQISNATYRVLAFAILTGAGFWYFGADIISLAINYFFATSMYELILKPAGAKSPKTTKDGKQ